FVAGAVLRPADRHAHELGRVRHAVAHEDVIALVPVFGDQVRRVGVERDEAPAGTDRRLTAGAVRVAAARADAHALGRTSLPVAYEHVVTARRVVARAGF